MAGGEAGSRLPIVALGRHESELREAERLDVRRRLLAGANCNRSYYSNAIGWWACLPRLDPRWGRNEAVISSHWQAQGLDYASDHAGRAPLVVAARLGRTFGFFRPRQQALFEHVFADRNRTEEDVGVVVYWVLLALAAGGAVVLRRRRTPLRLLLAPVALVVVTVATSYGSFRFRVAADLSIVLLAAVAVTSLGERLASRRGPAPAERVPALSGR